MNQDQMLRHANGVARAAIEAGHHPVRSLLIAPDNETGLLDQRKVDGVNHIEAVLARKAARLHAPAMLWGCTLVTTVEPCAMCAGTQYYPRDTVPGACRGGSLANRHAGTSRRAYREESPNLLLAPG